MVMSFLTCVCMWGRAAEPVKRAPGSALVAAPEGLLPPRVEVTIVGNVEGAQAAQSRIASWFEAQGVATERHYDERLNTHEVLSIAAKPGIRLWLVLDTQTAGRLFFAVQREGEPPRYLVHDIVVTSPLNELSLERLAQVAYLSAVALWEGNVDTSQQKVEQELGETRGSIAPVASDARRASSETRASVAPPAAKPTPAPKAGVPAGEPPRKGWRGHARFDFQVEAHGPEGTFWGPTWGGGIAYWWPHDFVGARVYNQLFLASHDVELSGVRLQISDFGFRLGLVAGHEVSRHLWLTGELMLLDRYITVRAESTVPSISTRDGHEFGLGVASSAGVAWEATRGINFGLSATLAVPFERYHYDVQDSSSSSGNRRLLTAWALQPGLQFTVGFF